MILDAEETTDSWSYVIFEEGYSPESKHTILVIGQATTGKSSLLQSLAENIQPSKGSPSIFEFSFAYPLEFWIFNSGPLHTSLLKFPLNNSTVSSSAAIILISASVPSDISRQLSENLSLLEEHVGRISTAVKIPIYFVLSKCASLTDQELLESQRLLRKTALNYDSGILFWDGGDLDVLKQSLLCRFEGKEPPKPRLTDNRAIFIPSGWDTSEKLALLEERIAKASMNGINRLTTAATSGKREEVVSPTDEQTFLSEKMKAPPAENLKPGMSSFLHSSSSRKQALDHIANQNDLSAFFHNLISGDDKSRRK